METVGFLYSSNEFSLGNMQWLINENPYKSKVVFTALTKSATIKTV